LSDALRLPAGNHPVEALLDLIERDKLSADVVLVPGDLTDKVDQAGMLVAWAGVKEIAGALGADLIATTLGNHDVDSREKHSADAFHIPLHLARDYPLAEPLARRDFWSDGFCILDHSKVRVLVLNSVAEHRSEELAERGSVTDELLQNLAYRLRGLEPRDLQVALVHHHPIAHEESHLGSQDLMVNGSLLLTLLGEHGFRVLVHGHKHHPRLRYFDGGGSPVLVFAAGSFAALGAHFFQAGNLFHILEMSSGTLLGCTQSGFIHSWAFTYGKGWAPSHPASHGIPSQAGFGCMRDPIALASQVAALVTNNTTSAMKWSDVVGALPEVAFMLPSHLTTLTTQLLNAHAIEVSVSRTNGLPLYVVPQSE
jgi:hypothetical protein